CAICPRPGGYHVKYEAAFRHGKVDERTFSARRTPEHNHYRIVQCDTCGLHISSPVFREDRIKSLYVNSCFTYEEEADNIKESYARLLRIASSYAPEKGRLLEIGGGNGFFLEEAQDQGYREVHGVEPSEDAVNRASARVRAGMKVAFYEKGTYPPESLEVVCCFHVLDHVLDPNTFVRTAYDNLVPGGVSLFVVHDVRAFSARVLGERSPIIDIEHIYLFDKKTLASLFQKNGFDVVKVFDITNVYSLGYWTRMYPLPRFLKGPLLKVISAFGLGKVRIGLKAGNIAIIARKPRMGNSQVRKQDAGQP
ncbi:MAG: class I SAM-dependent methyltransferase, partial [Chloroflexota bacterium]